MTSAKFWSCPTATSPGWKVLSMRRCCGWHRSMWAGPHRAALERRGRTYRRPRQRHHPAASRRAARAFARFLRRDRRWQPFFLQGPGVTLLPCAPARPEGGQFRSCDARRTGRAYRGVPGPGTCAVHQLAGHASRRRSGSRSHPVENFHAVRPAQAKAGSGVHVRRAFVPVCHHGFLARRRRPGAVLVLGDHRPDPVPAPR